jgi:uncharacterized protein (DUF779 family)
MFERVTASSAAAELLAELTEEHGPLMFHQSGGCCDGSSPMCYPRSEFRVGSRDIYLGDVGYPDESGRGVPFYISGPQYEYWKHTHLTVDVVPGRGGGFSIEAPRGVRFLIRSRLYTTAETAELKRLGSPPTGERQPAADAPHGR